MQNFFLGIAAILFGIMLWAIGIAIVKLIWHGLVCIVNGTFHWARSFCRNPKATLVESNFFVLLIALPFLLIYNKLYKWVRPAEYARRKAIVEEQNAFNKRTQEILKREGLECIYVEGNMICCVRIHEIEIDEENYVRFTVSPVVTKGFCAPAEQWGCLVRWENFFYALDRWSSEYYLVRWHLYFNETFIKKLKAYAESLSDEMQENERFDALNAKMKEILYP